MAKRKFSTIPAKYFQRMGGAVYLEDELGDFTGWWPVKSVKFLLCGEL